MSELRVGTSGWQYKHWKSRFYPPELPTAKWLEYYARHFDTVELNNPFYRQPEKKTFERWRRSVPDDFVYAVKLNRFITHLKRLNVDRQSIERSYGTMAGLGPKLAVVLVQLPPQMRFDEERAQRFFGMVARRRRRHALEPREASWFTDDALAFLGRRNIALVAADTPDWPTHLAVTADFVYLRFHGPGRRYASNYEDDALREWAERIKGWRAEERDVFAYFNNDEMGYAPRNALRLRELAAV
ncbi:MAG: DUF72 domain-containing protein [Chloroflexi bacterium]|nr:MAG: DUF72 domain-containing protein [Chloroflexota bacterium]